MIVNIVDHRTNPFDTRADIIIEPAYFSNNEDTNITKFDLPQFINGQIPLLIQAYKSFNIGSVIFKTNLDHPDLHITLFIYNENTIQESAVQAVYRKRMNDYHKIFGTFLTDYINENQRQYVLDNLIQTEKKPIEVTNIETEFAEFLSKKGEA